MNLKERREIERLRGLLADGIRLMGSITHWEGFPACTCEWCAWKRNVKDILEPAKLEDVADRFLKAVKEMNKQAPTDPDFFELKEWPMSCGLCDLRVCAREKCPRFASAAEPKVALTPLGKTIAAVAKSLREWSEHAKEKGDSATCIVLRSLAWELEQE